MITYKSVKMVLLKSIRFIKDGLPDNIYKWVPYIELVKNNSDNYLLNILPECSQSELITIGYYGIALNRHTFINNWWNLKNPPLSIDSLCEILIALELYRQNIVKDSPTKMLLAIFRSKMMRDIYNIILDSNINDSVINDDFLGTSVHLRILIIKYATSLPSGTSILYKVIKDYKYSSKVWNSKIHIINRPDFNAKNNLIVEYTGYQSNYQKKEPICTIGRYGSLKDFKILLKNFISFNPYFVSELNHSNLDYLIKLLKTVKKVCNIFPHNISIKIWNDYYLTEILRNGYYSELRRSTKIEHIVALTKFIPVLTPCFINSFLALSKKKELYSKYPNYIYSFYYTFMESVPKYPKPENLLLMEKNKPLLSPKAIGIDYKGIIPSDVYPYHYFKECIQCVICENDLYLVYDAKICGLWNERCNSYGRHHSHWNGPYLSIEDEQTDLRKFLQYCEDNNIKKKWWIKGVYKGPYGSNFFNYISNPPETIYKSNGWIIACNKGLFCKIVPHKYGTIKLVRCGGGWFYIGGVVANVYDCDRDFTEGVWKCFWDSTRDKWKPIETTRGKPDTYYYANLVKPFWKPLELLKWYNPFWKPIYAKKLKVVEDFIKKNKLNLNIFTAINTELGTPYINGYNTNPYIVAETNLYNNQKLIWITDLNMLYTHTTFRTFFKSNKIILTNFDKKFIPIINYSNTVFLKLKGNVDYDEIAKSLRENGFIEYSNERTYNIRLALWKK